MEEFSKIYSNLLDLFKVKGVISNYIEVDHCRENNGKPIIMYFTESFGIELRKRTQCSLIEINEMILKIVDIQDAIFETNDKHKELAFNSGFTTTYP